MRPPIDTGSMKPTSTEKVEHYSVFETNLDDGGIGRSLLLTVEEAAELLRLGRTTAYELVMRGLVPSVKIGRRRLIVRRGLEEFVNRLTESHDRVKEA